MQDYYLKFNNLEELWTTLLSLDLAQIFTDIDGKEHHVAKGINLDIIGTIHKPTGNMITIDSDTGIREFPEMLPIEGFHANIRGDLTEEQEAQLPLISPPNNPVRVWA
jgi:hypothetical protein